VDSQKVDKKGPEVDDKTVLKGDAALIPKDSLPKSEQ
jgi:hypothetical protein